MLKNVKPAKHYVLFTLLYLSLCAGTCPSQQQGGIPFREGYSLKLNTYTGYADLYLSKEKIVVGEAFHCKIAYFNTGEGVYLYNPFFNSVIESPAQLALFDSNKKYVGNLLKDELSLAPGPTDWTYVGIGFIGTTLELIMPKKVKTEHGNAEEKKITSGTYYLQLVYSRMFLHLLPSLTEKSSNQKKEDYKAELFRSNMVRVDIQNYQ